MNNRIRCCLFIMVLVVDISFAHAENHCKKFFENFDSTCLVHYGDFWSIKDDGTLDFKQGDMSEYPRASFKTNQSGDKIFIGANPGLGFKKYVQIDLDSKKRVTKITTKRGRIGEEWENRLQYELVLDYKNGNCFPSLYKRGLPDKDIPEFTYFNTEACIAFVNFLKNNKEALECRCGNDKTNAALKDMLIKYNIQSNSKSMDSIGFYHENEVFNMKNAGVTKREKELLPESVLNSLDFVRKCRTTPGVFEAMNDESLWRVKAENSSPSSLGQTVNK